MPNQNEISIILSKHDAAFPGFRLDDLRKPIDDGHSGGNQEAERNCQSQLKTVRTAENRSSLPEDRNPSPDIRSGIAAEDVRIQPELKSAGEIVHAFEPGVRMPHIDEDDVGRYAAAALLDPAKFDGTEIDLANENLTPEEVAAAFSEEIAAARDEGQIMQLWANLVDITVDSKATQEKYGIPLTSFKDYLRREKVQLSESIPN
ncbi:hypothetical protein BX600DRAFT_502122 [Xylariales sp. PMI_506]|nr:hypothetical protein BX600DRAFT_502122 [Xylariales sp. PMI_506]